MRFFRFFLVLLFSSTSLFGQQIVPMMNSGSSTLNPAPKSVVTYVKVDGATKMRDSVVTYDIEDSDSSAQLFIYGIGSADALQFDKLTAAGSLDFGAKLSPSLFCQAMFNYSGKVGSAKQSDSASLSELYFPDIANAAFSGSIEWNFGYPIKTQLIKKDIRRVAKGKSTKSYSHNRTHFLIFAADASLQNKTIEKDTSVYKLGLFNWNMGLKYRWNYKSKKNVRSSIVLGIFYNRVLISDNSDLTFNRIFNDYAAPGSEISPNFHGISCLFSFQIANSILYARTYTDFDRKNDLAFTVGIKQAVKIMSF